MIHCSKIKTKNIMKQFPLKKKKGYQTWLKYMVLKITKLHKAMKANKYKNLELHEIHYHMGLQATV